MLTDVVLASDRVPAGVPAPVAVAAIGLVAGALVLVTWPVVGPLVTVAHEGGHAIVALLLGGRIHHVHLNHDRTGSTTSSGAAMQLPVTLAGYVAPSVFGLAGALLLARGCADAVLWATVVLFALLLPVTATWFGRLVLVATGAALVLVEVRGAPGVRGLVACLWVWLLLIGGLVHVWQHRRGGSDFQALRRQSHVVPALAWAWLALTGAAVALVAGGGLLLGTLAPPG